jgi:hypothetical protein
MSTSVPNAVASVQLGESGRVLKRGRGGSAGEQDQREPHRLRLGDEEGEDEGGIVVTDHDWLLDDSVTERAVVDSDDDNDDEAVKAQQAVIDSDGDDDYATEEDDDDEDEEEELRKLKAFEEFEGIETGFDEEEEKYVEPCTGRRRGLRMMHDPDSYDSLDIGICVPPKSFAEKSKFEIAAKQAQGRVWIEAYFRARKEEAAHLDFAKPIPADASFCRKTLRIYQDPRWTVAGLADLFQSGQSDYVRYLSGLDRPRSYQEHMEIPAPTSEQLQGTLIYSDLIETAGGEEYRYGGSGTGKDGGGDRLANYNRMLRRFHALPAEEQVVRQGKSHTSMMLRPGSTCHLRVVMAWPRKQITPDMAIVMEAAQVDLERYMSDDVPDETFAESYWTQNHNKEIRDKSFALFPAGRRQGNFIGMNRTHPLRQGANTAVATHRRNICEEEGWVCTCCKDDKSSYSDRRKKHFRLAIEVFFPVEETAILCSGCVRAWRKVEVKDLDAALAMLENPPVGRQVRHRRQLAAQGHTCAYCDCGDDERSNGLNSKARLTGHVGEKICILCWNAESNFLKRHPNPSRQEVDEWMIQRKNRAAARKLKEPQRPVKDKGSCFTCGSNVEVSAWCGLTGFEGRKWCRRCYQVSIRKAGKALLATPEAFIRSRMEYREKIDDRVGYTATGVDSGNQCPCCSGLDDLNGDVCEINDHDDIWACDGCVEDWFHNDKHNMSDWYDFAVERKLGSIGTIDQRPPTERKFVCPDCGKSYKQSTSLYAHQRAEHGAALKRGTTEKPVADANGNFVCHNCGATYKSDKALYSHWSNKRNSCAPRADPKAGLKDMEKGEDAGDSKVQTKTPARSSRSTKAASKPATSSAKSTGKKAPSKPVTSSANSTGRKTQSTAQSSKPSSAKKAGRKAKKPDSESEWDAQEESDDE